MLFLAYSGVSRDDLLTGAVTSNNSSNLPKHVSKILLLVAAATPWLALTSIPTRRPVLTPKNICEDIVHGDCEKGNLDQEII
jgi:hypothetical protein